MKRAFLIAALSGGASVLAMTAALAQDQTDSEDTGAFELGEIVLYGDRSANTLADSTASVAVVGGDDLNSATTSDFKDVFARVANASAPHQNEAGFILRGVNSEGQTPGAFGTPLASYYIDGVQQTVESTRRGTPGMFDMQQLEVYRGPQSTLSGRAALAGAIYLRSAEPEFNNSGKVQLTYGENNLRRVGAMVNMSPNDTLAFRLSGEWSEKDSDLNYPSYEAYDLYDNFATDDYKQLRARMLWTPNGDDRTRVLVTYARSENSPTYNDIAGPDRTTIGSPAPSYDELRGDIWGDLTPFPNLLEETVPMPFFQNLRETTSSSFGVEATHEFDNGIMLTSQTSWNNSVTDRQSLNTGAAFDPALNFWDGITNTTEFDNTITSQELRLNYDDGALRWVAGAYVAKEKDRGTGAFDTTAAALVDPGQAVIQHSDVRADATNVALFGEVGYEVSSGLTVVAGARLDKFKRETTVISTIEVPGFGTLPPSRTDPSFEDTVLIPKLGLEYDLSDNAQVAFVYQQGYRPGGAGLRNSDDFAYEFDAETTHNYELSYRGSMMGDQLTLAASVFYNDWSNQQVEVWATPGDSSSSYIVNAGNSTSYGAELELSYAAGANLDVFASIGLLESEFEDFIVGDNDYSGQAFPLTARQNAAVGYRYNAGDGWFSSGTMTFTGARTGSLDSGVGGFGLDSYTVVDLEVGYQWRSGATLVAYANNLFDTTYFLNESGPGSAASLGDRREVGVQLTYSF